MDNRDLQDEQEPLAVDAEPAAAEVVRRSSRTRRHPVQAKDYVFATWFSVHLGIFLDLR